MRCLRCHYDLRGVRFGRCPECGQPFDPSDPSTWYVGPRRWSGSRLFAVHVIASAWLIIITLAIHLTYAVAAVVLGRLPVPSRDDPKDIPYLTAPMVVVWILMLAWPLTWPVMLAAPAAALRDRRWNAAAALLLLSLLAWFIGFAVNRWDPFHSIAWFQD